jgi:hypothetical protein
MSCVVLVLCRVPTLPLIAFLRMPRGKDEPKKQIKGQVLYRHSHPVTTPSDKADKGQIKGMVLYRPAPYRSRQPRPHPPAASLVAGLTEPGNPRHPRRPPTWMTKGQGNDRLFSPWRAWRPWREPTSGGEENRAKGAKGATVFRRDRHFVVCRLQIKAQVLYRPKLVRPNSAMGR